jgi:hypothetical protein
MTLVELILALLLLNVVILTGISMEIGVRRISSATDIESLLLGELAPLVASITTDINRGIGNTVNLSYSTTNLAGCANTLRIRTDFDNDGTCSAGDVWVAYCRTAGNIFRYYPNAAFAPFTMLSNRTSRFTVTMSNDQVIFVLGARSVPGAAVNATNPEVTINSSAQARGASFQ